MSYKKYFAEIATAFWESDEALKQKKLADVKRDVVPFYLEKLDAAAKENNGHLALGHVRIDIKIYSNKNPFVKIW